MANRDNPPLAVSVTPSVYNVESSRGVHTGFNEQNPYFYGTVVDQEQRADNLFQDIFPLNDPDRKDKIKKEWIENYKMVIEDCLEEYSLLEGPEIEYFDTVLVPKIKYILSGYKKALDNGEDVGDELVNMLKFNLWKIHYLRPLFLAGNIEMYEKYLNYTDDEWVLGSDDGSIERDVESPTRRLPNSKDLEREAHYASLASNLGNRRGRTGSFDIPRGGTKKRRRRKTIKKKSTKTTSKKHYKKYLHL